MRDPRIKIKRVENCFEGKIKYAVDSISDYEPKDRYVRLRDL